MKVTIEKGTGYFNLYGNFAGRFNEDTEATVVGRGRYPIEAKVILADGRKILVQRRFFVEETDCDPENIYNIPSMRQSIEEDRRLRRF